MRALRPPLSLALVVVATLACGKLKPADADAGGAGTGGAGTGGRTLVTISGTAAPHPLNAMLNQGSVAPFTNLTVAIVDPAVALTNPGAPPTASMALDTTTAPCCQFSFAGVDITNITLGIVGTLEDQRTGDARLWVKTGTGIGTGDFLKQVRLAPAPITDRRVFAVSRALEGKLVAFVDKVLGLNLAPGDLEGQGFLIGHVVGKLSEGHPDPGGIIGATVTPGGVAAASFDLIYPDASFTAKGTSTAASGIFLMIPRARLPIVTTWDIVPPAGETRTWPQYLAGASPGSAFVAIMPANE